MEQVFGGGQDHDRRLFGAILAERIGLALRFVNQGSEPGRGGVWQIETHWPRVEHPTFRAAS